jgi:hypothetical protein
MDVRLPNGVVITGIPEGTTQTQILSRLRKADPELYKMALHAMPSDGPSPAEDVGAFDAAMIAAGGATSALSEGARELWTRVKPYADPSQRQTDLAAIQSEGEERRRLMGPLEEARPVATALGASLPAFAIPMGAPARAAGGILGRLGMKAAGKAIAASPVADAMLTGAALGAVDADTSAAGGAAGGLAGGLIGKGFSRVLRPVVHRTTPSQRRAVDVARRHGFKLTPAQATDSPALTRLEASFRSTPAAAGTFRALDEANQTTINRMAAESIGEAADNVTDDVLDAAYRNIGRKFDEVGEMAGKVNVDDTLLGKVVGVADDYFDEAGEKLPQYDRILRVLDKDAIDGRTLLNEASKLGKQAARTMKSNPPRAFALLRLKDALDDAVMEATEGGARRTLARARRQWKNLMTLMEPGAIKDPTRGNVSAATVGNVLRRKDKVGFMRGKGRGPLADVGRIGKAFPQHPDSGTAQRLAVPLLTAGAGGTAGYAMSEGDLGQAAVAGGAGMAIPFALQALGGRGYRMIGPYLEHGLPLLGRQQGFGRLAPAPADLARGLLGRLGAGGGVGGLLSPPK